MKKIFLLLILIVTFLASCKKMDPVTPDTTSKTTKDLVINPTFDWKTSKEITLSIIGLKEVDSMIINTLYVKSSVGDTIYYKDLLIMNTDYIIKFSVPSTETKVILVYGSKTKTLDLLSNSITFDYIIE